MKHSRTDTSYTGGDHAQPSHGEIMVVIGALMLAMLLAALDQTIVSTALPTIASDLHGLNELSWVATAYLLASAVSTPLYGKISDLFGRKRIFQFSIGIFLLGSVLCGLSQNMSQLIAFRALQGLGGGGIFALALAIVGDIVSPRQRGRYQGYFGAVFAVSSVIGPLLGGLITDHLSWRWIFYVNLPVGALALSAVALRLHLPVHRTGHKIDFVGAGLLSASTICLLLVTVLGGATYSWTSSIILGLAGAGLALCGLLIAWEARVPEPILPLRLFRSDIFRVASVLSLLSGLVMFAAIIYLPEYQQIVRHYSATKSGLLMLPLVGGIMTASVISGRLISRYGKYRIFPIVGSVLIGIGLWLFSHVTVSTSQLELALWMVLLGLGIGSFMQVMVLAVQNSTERQDMGTATSTVTFFRTIGSSFGAAIFGAILVTRLNHHLAQLLPQAASQNISANSFQSGVSHLASLPPQVSHTVFVAFAQAFSDIFIVAIPFAVITLIVAFFLREAPLRTSITEDLKADPLEFD
jgi:EmrB/QacA subfamily drug resistance transporter